jgi:hypothetical protein
MHSLYIQIRLNRAYGHELPNGPTRADLHTQKHTRNVAVTFPAVSRFVDDTESLLLKELSFILKMRCFLDWISSPFSGGPTQVGTIERGSLTVVRRPSLTVFIGPI